MMLPKLKVDWSNDEVVASSLLPRKLTNGWKIGLDADATHLTVSPVSDIDDWGKLELNPQVARDVWDRFLELSNYNTRPDDVLTYARDYGPLGLCLAHGRRSHHVIGRYEGNFNPCDDWDWTSGPD